MQKEAVPAEICSRIFLWLFVRGNLGKALWGCFIGEICPRLFVLKQGCGVRRDGNTAPQVWFWKVNIGVSFLLAIESEGENNAAIMLARRSACNCNIVLAGPEDRTPSAATQ